MTTPYNYYAHVVLPPVRPIHSFPPVANPPRNPASQPHRSPRRNPTVRHCSPPPAQPSPNPHPRYLNINWVEGEKWFHWTLVDADVAINAMMWQNAGRSGIDQVS